MTPEDLKRVRSAARVMTLDGLREAHAHALHMFATAGTPEAAQRAHDLTAEYAEAYQRRRAEAP
jgi:hypothetical protein